MGTRTQVCLLGDPFPQTLVTGEETEVCVCVSLVKERLVIKTNLPVACGDGLILEFGEIPAQKDLPSPTFWWQKVPILSSPAIMILSASV